MASKHCVVKLSNFQADFNRRNPDNATSFWLIDTKRYMMFLNAQKNKNHNALKTMRESSEDFRPVAIEELHKSFYSITNPKNYGTIFKKLEDIGILRRVDLDSTFVVAEEDLEDFKFCKDKEFEENFKRDMEYCFAECFDSIFQDKINYHQEYAKFLYNQVDRIFSSSDKEEQIEYTFYDMLLSKGLEGSVLEDIFNEAYIFNPKIVQSKAELFLLGRLYDGQNLLSNEFGNKFSPSLDFKYLKDVFSNKDVTESMFVEEMISKIGDNFYQKSEKEQALIRQAFTSMHFEISDLTNPNSGRYIDDMDFFEAMLIYGDSLVKKLDRNLLSRNSYSSSENLLSIFDIDKGFPDSSYIEMAREEVATFDKEFKIKGKDLKNIIVRDVIGIKQDYLLTDNIVAGRHDDDYLTPNQNELEEGELRTLIKILKPYNIQDSGEYSYSQFLSILREFEKDLYVDFTDSSLSTTDISNLSNLLNRIDICKKNFLSSNVVSAETSMYSTTMEDNLRKLLAAGFNGYGFKMTPDDFDIKKLSVYDELRTLLQDMDEIGDNLRLHKIQSQDLLDKNENIISQYYNLFNSSMSTDYAIPRLINNQLYNEKLINPIRDEFKINNILYQDLIFIDECLRKRAEATESTNFNALAEYICRDTNFRLSFIKAFGKEDFSQIDFSSKETVAQFLFEQKDSFTMSKFELKIQEMLGKDGYKLSLNDLIYASYPIKLQSKIANKIDNELDRLGRNSINIYNYDVFKGYFENTFNDGKRINSQSEFIEIYKQLMKRIDFNNPEGEDYKRYQAFLDKIKETSRHKDENFEKSFPSENSFNQFFATISMESMNHLQKLRNDHREQSLKVDERIATFVDRYNASIPDWCKDFKLEINDFKYYLISNTDKLATYDSYLFNYNRCKSNITELSYCADKDYHVRRLEKLLRDDTRSLTGIIKDFCKNENNLEIFKKYFGEEASVTDITTNLVKNYSSESFRESLSSLLKDISSKNPDAVKKFDLNHFEDLIKYNELIKKDFKEYLIHGDLRTIIQDDLYGINRNAGVNALTIESFAELASDKNFRNLSMDFNVFTLKESINKLKKARVEENKFCVNTFNQCRDILNDDSLSMQEKCDKISEDLMKNIIKIKGSNLDISLGILDELSSNPQLDTSKLTQADIDRTLELLDVYQDAFKTKNIKAKDDLDILSNYINHNSAKPVADFSSCHNVGSIDFYMNVLCRDSNSLAETSHLIEGLGEEAKKHLQTSDHSGKSLRDKINDLSPYFDEYVSNEIAYYIETSKSEKELDTKLKIVIEDFAKKDIEIDDKTVSDLKDLFTKVKSFEHSISEQGFESLGTLKVKTENSQGLFLESSERLIRNGRETNLLLSNADKPFISNVKMLCYMDDKFLEHFKYDKIIEILTKQPSFEHFCKYTPIKDEYGDTGETVKSLNMAAVVIGNEFNGKGQTVGLMVKDNNGSKYILSPDLINSLSNETLIDMDYFSKKQEKTVPKHEKGAEQSSMPSKEDTVLNIDVQEVEADINRGNSKNEKTSSKQEFEGSGPQEEKNENNKDAVEDIQIKEPDKEEKDKEEETEYDSFGMS